MLEHIVPDSVVKAAADNEVLQVVFWSILFGVALTRVPADQRAVSGDRLDALADVMFKFTGLVMAFAPVGIAAAMAVTVGERRADVLGKLALLVGTLYAALVVFLLGVLVPVALRRPGPAREVLAGGQGAGPDRVLDHVVGGGAAQGDAGHAGDRGAASGSWRSSCRPGTRSTWTARRLYLAVASVFAAQAAGVEMTLGQQLVMMLTLMVTSKGVAAVPRASLVILAGTLTQFRLPLEAVAVIFGVDTLMDMARTTVNLIGNCLAACVMARWEGEFGQATGEPLSGDDDQKQTARDADHTDQRGSSEDRSDPD